MNHCFGLPLDFEPATSGKGSSQMCFSVREAVWPDLPALADLLTDCFHSREGQMGWIFPFLRTGIYEDLRHRLRGKNTNYICLVALGPVIPGSDLPRLVGTVELALRSPCSISQQRRFPYISNLAVDAAWRRRGVAKSLLTNCEAVALQWGYSEIYLHVLENNHNARGLYYNCGYRLETVEEGWPSWFFAQPRRILLKKSLLQPT